MIYAREEEIFSGKSGKIQTAALIQKNQRFIR